MKSISFPEVKVEIAKDQKEYNTLPSWVGNVEIDNEGGLASSVVCCMKLEPREVEDIQKHGKIWCQFLTFGKPLQPFKLLVMNNYFDPLDNPPSGSVEMGHKESKELKIGFWKRLKLLFKGSIRVHIASKVETYSPSSIELISMEVKS